MPLHGLSIHLFIHLSLQLVQTGKTSSLVGGEGGSGCGVCAEMGGRLLALELFRNGHKPGQWT